MKARIDDSARRQRGRLLASTILGSIGLVMCSTAQAQEQSTATEVDTRDENQVDLRTLQYGFRDVDISIGQGDFPSRLSVTREPVGYSYEFGEGVGSDKDAFIGNPGNGASIYPLLKNIGSGGRIAITIGARVRTFDGTSGQVSSPGTPFFPTDGSGGYVTKTVEGTTTVYTYYSSSGDQLRFVVDDATACGRTANISGDNVTCSRVSNWKSASGVTAAFQYYNRGGRYVGYFNETDISSIKNSIGLSLSFNYSTFKDSGKYTEAVYSTSSITASSDLSAVCGGQVTCSRQVSYQYTVTPPTSSNVLAYTADFVTYFTDTRGFKTQYLYVPAANTPHELILQSIRLPSNPSADVIKFIPGSPYVVEDGAGNDWQYTLTKTTSGITTTRIDPAGGKRVYSFDTSGRILSLLDEENRSYSFSYDGRGRLLQRTTPDLITHLRSYDDRGNVLEERTKAYPAGTAPDVVTSATYDPAGYCSNPVTCNKPVTTTDALGNVTNYIYDPTHGGVLSVTRPAAAPGGVRPQERVTYGLVLGAYVPTSVSRCQTRATCAGSLDERKLLLAYQGNIAAPTSITEESGDGSLSATVQLSYDPLGNVISRDGPLSGSDDTTFYRYDRDGNLIGQIAPDPDGSGSAARAAQRLTYDQNGTVTKDEKGVVASPSDADWAAFASKSYQARTLDVNGRTVKVTKVVGGVTQSLVQVGYDAAGRISCEATRMDATTFSSLPADSCTPAASTNGQTDRIVHTMYNKASQVTQVTEGYGSTNPVNAATITYDTMGRTGSVVDANSNVTSYGYDTLGRRNAVYFPSLSLGAMTSSSTDSEVSTFDQSGNVVSRRLRDGQIVNYAYDALNRLTRETLPGADPAISYVYDLLDEVTSITQGSQTLSYTYDALGRGLTEVSLHGAFTSTWDTSGRRTQLRWPDGFYVSYDYNAANEMTAIRENGSLAASGLLASYAYDDLGNQTSITYGNGVSIRRAVDAEARLKTLTIDLAGTSTDLTRSFSYNLASQISTISNTSTAYDFGGIVTGNRTYVSNGLNQYTSVAGVSAAYDARGNLTRSGTSGYSYNSTGRLTGGPGGTLLQYDPALRLQKIQAGAVATQFGYDGVNLTSEFDQSNALKARYVYGSDGGGPIVEYGGPALATRSWLSSDERGSVIAVTNDAGTVIAINSYDEYGVPAASNVGRFQYAGAEWLEDVGLYYMRNRMYSPTFGRFLQPDPEGYGDGLNRYSYVNNDPINSVDPLGLQSDPIYEPSHCQQCNDTISWGDDSDLIIAHTSSPVTEDTSPGFDLSAFQAATNYGGYGALAALFRGPPLSRQYFGPVPVPLVSPQSLLQRVKSFLCSAPAVAGGGGLDAYAGVGGSVSGAVSFNPRNGQISIGFDTGVGVGVGGGGRIAGGRFAGIGNGSSESLPIAGGGVNVNGTAVAGPAGITGSYQLLGSNKGDFGLAATGGAELSANVNVSAHGQFNLPSLYSLGCQ